MLDWGKSVEETREMVKGRIKGEPGVRVWVDKREVELVDEELKKIDKAACVVFDVLFGVMVGGLDGRDGIRGDN